MGRGARCFFAQLRAQSQSACGLTVEGLRRISLFAAASAEDAHWLLSQCILVTLAPDEWLRREGDPAEFYVMLEGELRITRKVGGVDTYITTLRDGDFFGEVPLLLGLPFMVSGRAVSPCRLLRLAEEAFWGMLTECLSANRRILRKLAERTQLLQSITAQQEKLAALGTLAAGLAHELNNPVSAVVSGVGELEGLLRSLPSLALRIDREALSEAQRTCLEARAGEGAPVPAVGVLARGDAEEALVAWLEARKVEDAWELAPSLVEAGLDAARLERDFVGLSGSRLAVALRWLATTRGAVSALEQIRQGGLRISALVDAAKAYAYLDQAPVQEVDVHEGLESTLTMLGFRLHGVEVLREYDRRLPRITAYGNELNQVWTSLVENALDAMAGDGAGAERRPPHRLLHAPGGNHLRLRAGADVLPRPAAHPPGGARLTPFREVDRRSNLNSGEWRIGKTVALLRREVRVGMGRSLSGTHGLWHPSGCSGLGGSRDSIFAHTSSGSRQPSSCFTSLMQA